MSGTFPASPTLEHLYTAAVQSARAGDRAVATFKAHNVRITELEAWREKVDSKVGKIETEQKVSAALSKRTVALIVAAATFFSAIAEIGVQLLLRH